MMAACYPFSAFEAFPRGLDLSIACFQACQHEHQNFFSFFVTSKLTPLTGLVWDLNSTEAGFFDLLRKSLRLLSRSVSGCFSDVNCTSIYQLAAYLRTAKLTSFSIAGHKSEYLGRFLAVSYRPWPQTAHASRPFESHRFRWYFSFLSVPVFRSHRTGPNPPLHQSELARSRPRNARLPQFRHRC